MKNKDNELFNGIIDVPTGPQMPGQNTNNNQNLEYNFNFETQVETPQPVQDNTMPSETIEPQLTDEEKKALNEEKLKSLTADTNELVNPNLIVTPSLKPIGMQTQTISQENSAQEEKGGKGKYVFAFFIIGLIVLFIVYLPKLIEIFGF